MKRTTLKRTGFLARHKPLAVRNPARQATRRKKKPRLKASVRREALRLAGQQCTAVIDPRKLFGPPYRETQVRCRATEDLQVHETRYPAEVQDCVVVCRYHHHLIESQLRPWNRGRLGR